MESDIVKGHERTLVEKICVFGKIFVKIYAFTKCSPSFSTSMNFLWVDDCHQLETNDLCHIVRTSLYEKETNELFYLY